MNSYGNGIPAGFVTMRPGTRLIQRDVTTDNTVYAVETNGILRPITTANAIALYGSTWASRVTKVSDQNFLSYTVSTSLPTGQYPIGTLLKKTTGPDVFYLDGTNYRRIANEAAFNANRFNARFIVKTSMNFNASGAEITGMESGLINAAQNGGTITNPTNPTTPTTSGVVVSLNANTAPTTSIVNNQALAELASFNFTAVTASTNNTLKVNGTYKNVTSAVYSGNKLTVVFANNEVISAGTSKTFEIYATTGVSGQGSESITTKISEDASYNTTGNFVWSDGASITAPTYSNGHRVSGLTTNTQVMNK